MSCNPELNKVFIRYGVSIIYIEIFFYNIWELYLFKTKSGCVTVSS